MKKLIVLAVLTILRCSDLTYADKLTSGAATITFYKTAWDKLAATVGPQPVLTLTAFLDQAEANALTPSQISTNTAATVLFTNQIYSMNGATVTNLPGRTTQPTTFSFTPGRLIEHTGSIGLGGITRFEVLGGLGGNLLFGDYTLQYNSSRISLGGSGWYLQGNIPPAAPVFDLLNVKVTDSDGVLSIVGDLAVSFEVANFLFNTPADALAIIGSLSFFGQSVATVSAGVATINYDKSAWDSLASGYSTPPVLSLSAFFTQAEANALTQDQLLASRQADAPYTNEIYALNGSTVTNLPSRYAQPTTFSFPRGQLTNHTGRIGLGGVARFSVSLGGSLLFGDFTLQYDTNRISVGGTGWYLFANIPPAAPVFDLLNTTVNERTNSFTISGDLGVSFEVANLLFATPSDALRVIGTFSLTGAITPLTPPRLSQVTLANGGFVLRSENGLPGTSFTIITTTNVALPLSVWRTSETGVFDSNGSSTSLVRTNSEEPVLFMGIKQP